MSPLASLNHHPPLFQLLESDGEVSQFDSLDNSEGGMSAENFNTLKKGPLVAPIEPPQEFQDSPQTTMLRRAQLRTQQTTSYQEFAQLLIKDILGEAFLSILQHNPSSTSHQYHLLPTPVLKRTRISASDSQLNISSSTPALITPTIAPTATVENIYDEPSDSTRNSDDIEVDYYISKQLSASLARKKSSTLSANSQRLSSLQQLRPHSRNSLQSRLSSSHNSLATVGTSNKVDDTTFITQAMSHDPLMSRQSIIDFYNVPHDSDIYALPVDVVLVAEGERETGKAGSSVAPQPQRRKHDSHGYRRLPGHHTRRHKMITANGGTAAAYPILRVSSGEMRRRAINTAASSSCSQVGEEIRKGSKSVAKSQLASTGGVTVDKNRLSIGSGGGGGGGGSAMASAKRYSAPDGLSLEVVAVVEGGGTAGGSSGTNSTNNNNKTRGKRKEKQEKVNSSSSKQPIAGKKEQQQQAMGSGNNSSSKQKERKGNCIPLSTSFTSQSTMQSNSVSGGGASVMPVTKSAIGGSAGSRSSGGSKATTKRSHNQFSANLKQKFCSIFR